MAVPSEAHLSAGVLPPAPPRSTNRPGHRWLPWIVGALGIVLTISSYELLQSIAARNLALRAEDEASTRTAALDRALVNITSVVTGGRALFDASEDVTRQEFSRISQALAMGAPGLRDFCFIRRVSEDEREAFERAKRSEGLANFSIRDYTKDGTLVPAAHRNEHFPIDYLEPAPMPDVFGYDLAGSPRRFAPLQAAADHNRITSDVNRALFSDGRLGIAIVAPVYHVPDPPLDVPARRRLLRGFVGALVELAPFVDASLPPDRPTQVVDTYILDEQDALLYAREHAGAAEHLSTPAAIRASSQTQRTIDVADHKWTLLFRSHLTSTSGGRMSRVMVLLLGLALTIFVVLYTRRLQYSEGRLEALVEARTRDLRLTHEQLQQAQKMEAVGRLTGGIAHDFNNLLTVIMGNIALARESIDDEHVVTSMLDPALQAAERGADLTRRLLAFSRRQTLRPSVVRLPELVESLRPLVARTLGEMVMLEVKSDGDVWPVLADASQIETALVNLCLNARDAMPAGGRITVSMENTVLSADPARADADIVAGDYVVIDVTDTGMGMTDDVREKAFEPFFTTKPIGKGSGLGLSMVFGFVKQSNGHVTLTSAPGHGTTVRMFFPRARTS
jgi:signal transduction histidine kinase